MNLASLQWQIAELPYTQQGSISLDRLCNSFTIRNTGNTTVIINRVDTLQVGDSKSYGGNTGEIFVGEVFLSFGAGTNPVAVVSQKFYSGTNFKFNI